MLRFLQTAHNGISCRQYVGRATYVDLSAFPEGKDTAFAGRCFIGMLIIRIFDLGIKKLQGKQKRNCSRIFYENTPEEQARKQKKSAEGNRSYSEIITDDMTDEEKNWQSINICVKP